MQRTIRTVEHRTAILAVLFFVVGLACTVVTAPGSRAEMQVEQLKIATRAGEFVFQVEIAQTPEEKARGLMFRRDLGERSGMLFPYEPPQEATMWMQNTYISLDMVFIRSDGTVHRIAEGTEPFSTKIIASNGPVSAVLELKAGVAKQIGLAPGDVIHNVTISKNHLK